MHRINNSQCLVLFEKELAIADLLEPKKPYILFNRHSNVYLLIQEWSLLPLLAFIGSQIACSYLLIHFLPRSSFFEFASCLLSTFRSSGWEKQCLIWSLSEVRHRLVSPACVLVHFYAVSLAPQWAARGDVILSAAAPTVRQRGGCVVYKQDREQELKRMRDGMVWLYYWKVNVAHSHCLTVCMDGTNANVELELVIVLLLIQTEWSVCSVGVGLVHSLSSVH